MSQPKTYIQVDGQTLDADTVAKPANRDFRDAWATDGMVITVDMVKARNIHRDHIRAARAEAFAANDIAINDAILEDNVVGKAAAIVRRDELRNATSDPAIEAAQTPEELVLVVPAGLILE